MKYHLERKPITNLRFLRSTEMTGQIEKEDTTNRLWRGKDLRKRGGTVRGELKKGLDILKI